MNQVQKLFVDKAIMQPGGWAIYGKNDAIEFVKACKKFGVRILGIDGFFRGKDITHPSIPNLSVNPDSVQPSMEHSVDFSSPEFKSTNGNIYDEAVSFLKRQNDSMFFEIVCA